VETGDAVVAFTFDDGPDPAYTPGVLRALGAHEAKATFFVLGECAAAHPDLVQRAVAEGHEIALHGRSHRAMPQLTPAGRLSSLVQGRRQVARAAGRRPDWFRAPYGQQTGDVVVASRLLGMRPVMWSAYACEWEDRSLDSCIQHAAAALHQGSILLLHDGRGGDSDRPRRDPDEIVSLVEALLTVASERHLQVVSVGELLARGRPRQRFWFRSWKI
jgi:peptidoglycan-N-acetylglucosamine deacetylase